MAEPSVILAEAIKSISHATTTALRTYEQGARAQIAQAQEEIRQLRHERDQAVTEVHVCRQQEQTWQQEILKWKAAIDQAEVANSHQIELIEQIRREAQQWKDQYLRLEESSRQEAQGWKDQYTRVEQDRARLSGRLEQLVTDQHNHMSTTPYAPKPNGASAINPPTTTTFTKRASTSSVAPSLLASTSTLPPQTPSTRRPRSSTVQEPKYTIPPSAPSAPAQVTAPIPATSGQPLVQSRVIRRVHAVINIPVKEEDEDEDDGHPSTQTQPRPRQPTSPKKRPTSRVSNASASRSLTGRARKQQPVSESGSEDEEEYDEQDYEDDGEVDEDADADGDYVEPRAAKSGIRRKKTSLAGARTGRLAEDEEDELAMGAEDNHGEVYGHLNVGPPRGRPRNKTTSAPAPTAPTATPSSANKRKQRPSEAAATTPAKPVKARKAR
ncbi:uncharacterized protein STEHIDRAFT_169037 [Stereum hirsutum FP-91666 SS1]|uniref:uncharacterized protein n=1 Tax=Stereum hirsutum (strain FP-91666) TaxID=721885 RepID=UPI000444A3DF|nr:uncharacterized protein STEHIDRAFT_169037 [Stereum hirsutum FP-91666 SS1]EIM86027.1 hypothetical protein STEHIDRAFT_169037 [Stereum hirsutum FP-91666 SS1]